VYLMYVDESGDTGLRGSPTSYFALTGLVVHERRWRDFLNQLVAFRKTVRGVYSLPVRTEIHASEFINGRVRAIGGSLIPRPDKLAILGDTLNELAQIDFISITNVIIDKSTKIGRPQPYDIFAVAWGTLFQRFENTLINQNFPGRFGDNYGMVITDATAGSKLLRMVRKMAVYNPIPNNAYYGPGYRNIPIVRVIEDRYGKDSEETLPIQMVDVAAYFLHQKFKPNAFVQRSGAQHYLDRLQPVLNRHARPSHPLGIVTL
jgi:Protein of unknown function (DUF3800)